MPKVIDLRGHTFGKLEVVARDSNSAQGKARWACRCSCGNQTTIVSASLLSGVSKSCGCLNIELTRSRETTHGKTKTPEFSVWQDIHRRCYNKNFRQYKDYGGRGITVSEEWKKFETFLKDMGPRPSKSHTIERVNNSSGYSKENCVWATRQQQNNNRRDTRLFTYLKVTKSLADWCREFNVNYGRVSNRLYCGWEFEKAIGTPIKVRNMNKLNLILSLSVLVVGCKASVGGSSSGDSSFIHDQSTDSSMHGISSCKQGSSFVCEKTGPGQYVQTQECINVNGQPVILNGPNPIDENLAEACPTPEPVVEDEFTGGGGFPPVGTIDSGSGFGFND